jgi:hypothetical protein
MSIAGELVTETFGYDGGRPVTAYVPPGPPEAVVFAGDGQLISQWGGVLESAGVPPVLIVGAHRPADETLRLHEYSPGFDPERFTAHEAFFVEEVRGWARSRFGVALPAGRTAVLGVSASWRSPLGCGTRRSTARSFAPRRAVATGRPACFLARFRARTSSPARGSPSSARTRPGGPMRCAVQARTS